MEYQYVQNPKARKPIILLDQYIGTNEQGVTGIDEGTFTREVLALKNAGVKEAEVWINSKGGLWSTGVGIVSAMRNSGINFTTRNMGFADSTAGHIFQAGNVRIWEPYAIGLIHEIQGHGSAEVMDAMNASVATMLCAKTNKSKDDVRALMANNTMMDADMAKRYGFCDDLGKGHDILKFTNSSEAYECGQKNIKNLLPKNKSMDPVSVLLGLSNEASEASKAEAISKIIEARNMAERALADKDKELAAVNATLTTKSNELLVAQNAILEATNNSKKVAAEALVKEHLGTRIVDTPENITRFTNMAIADYDNAKAIILAINVNKQAPKTPGTQGQRSDKAPVISVGEYMSR